MIMKFIGWLRGLNSLNKECDFSNDELRELARITIAARNRKGFTHSPAVVEYMMHLLAVARNKGATNAEIIEIAVGYLVSKELEAVAC